MRAYRQSLTEDKNAARRAKDALRHRLKYAQKKHALMQTRLSQPSEIAVPDMPSIPHLMRDSTEAHTSAITETHTSAIAVQEAHTSAITVPDMTIPHLTEEQTSVIAVPEQMEAQTSEVVVPVSTQVSILRQQPSAEVCYILIFHSTEPERSIYVGTHTNSNEYTENAYIQSSVIG
jgi:hypothetical protein